MKIYTRTGDAGQTSIIGGQRLPKDSPRIEAYGTIDELNSFLGLLASSSSCQGPQRRIIELIQNRLFNLGAYLAGASKTGITAEDIKTLETSIDEMDHQLPPQHSFFLPGGCTLAARAHIARTVCRRAERRMVTLSRQMTIAPETITFVNRLSDWLFTFSRLANLHAGVAEKIWQQPV